LIATNGDVVEYSMETRKYQGIFKLGSMYLALWDKFSDIMVEFSQGNMEKAWGDFKFYLEASERVMPRKFRYIKNQYTGGKTVRIDPLPFDEACKRYEKSFPLFNGLMGGMMVFGDGSHLFPILAHAFGAVIGIHHDKNRIQAMERANGNIVIGGKTKRIEIVDKELQKDDKNVLHTFGSPVYDMIAVPIEVYNEGIKQRVLQRKGQRAAHAKGGKAKAIVIAA
jgi:hypothetical protein